VPVWCTGERLWGHAVSVNAADHDSWNNLALVLLHDAFTAPEGAPRAALHGMSRSLFETALRLHPLKYKYHCNLGSVLKEAGHTAEAKASLQSALRLQPSDAVAMANLEQIARAAGEDPGYTTVEMKSAIRGNMDEEDMGVKLVADEAEARELQVRDTLTVL
jgi:tetratricopeptide (TPR) repeat protein